MIVYTPVFLDSRSANIKRLSFSQYLSLTANTHAPHSARREHTESQQISFFSLSPNATPDTGTWKRENRIIAQNETYKCTPVTRARLQMPFNLIAPLDISPLLFRLYSTVFVGAEPSHIFLVTIFLWKNPLRRLLSKILLFITCIYTLHSPFRMLGLRSFGRIFSVEIEPSSCSVRNFDNFFVVRFNSNSVCSIR